jgi:hypothetical protein
VLEVLGDLLDPAEQRNPGALGIVPPALSRLGRVNRHGAPAFLGDGWCRLAAGS